MSLRGQMSRTEKAKLNMSFSLLQQIIAFICGLIVPRMMLSAFGSEAYGATSSISTFLAYVTLLEGGVGVVTRSALYKVLGGSIEDISKVINETKRFYRKIAIIFILYVFVLASVFKQISHNTIFTYWYSFTLVIVIAISIFFDYFIGISYTLLLQADQLNYIAVIFRCASTILNTIFVVFLIYLHCDLLIVKIVSSIVFLLRPVMISIYVKRRYKLTNDISTEKLLKNKSSALGQHIAWTLHNNTDITVLTIFKGLKYVSVYSVHNMVISQLQNIISSFTSGMEAVFGSMIGNGESDNLKKTFGYYETLISIISISLFSTAAVLIVPFIEIYTAGITDIKYTDPIFAISLIIASNLYCMRTPYGNIIIAAGRYKETQIGAYGEAILNIVISITLVIKFGLVGVAIGTVVATLFRFFFYVEYLSNHIIYRPMTKWYKRLALNGITFFSIYYSCTWLISHFVINSYSKWVLAGIIVTVFASTVSVLMNFLFYRIDVLVILKKGFKQFNIR